jgi:glycosyltransferase involved in cell wall biosynthesis
VNVTSPIVSVVIPTHNRSKLLRRAVESVLTQTYDSYEVIVVDDASTDDTAELMNSFDDPRVRYLQHDINRHASASRNTGSRAGVGKYIAYLDDDDEWLSDKLVKQIELIENAPPTVGMVYCWLDYIDAIGRTVVELHPSVRGRVFGQVLDRQRLGNSSTLIVRREVFEAVGGFDEELPRGNDGDFIRRVALCYAVDVVPEVLVKVHLDHGSSRITSSDEQGTRNAIKSQAVKLTKFKEELPKYRRQTATIYAIMAHHYVELGEWRPALHHYTLALRWHVGSSMVYFNMLRSVKAGVLRRKVAKASHLNTSTYSDR